MQIMTLETISPQMQASLASSDFSSLTRNFEQKTKSTSLQPFVNFRGQMSVGDIFFPVQMFSMREEGKFTYLQNYPEKLFPKLEIILEEKNLELQVKEFAVRPFNNSVEEEISYTRFFLLTSEVKKCSLHIKDADIPPFNFSFAEISSEVKKQVIHQAKLFRKLGFIEFLFKIKFDVPKEISPNDVRQIEILFRGLTEGEFSAPLGDSITVFNYKLNKSDLQNHLTSQKREFSFEFNEDLLVLGKFFPIGKMSFKMEKASIANPGVVQKFKENETIPSLRLNIFDYQVSHRFEKYSDAERLSKNKQKLDQYKNTLRKDEPSFLINLFDEPLAEIDDKSAIGIVEGLLQYYGFPDRFSVLKPKLEKNRWRVPIALTYPKYEPIWLEDAFVDVRTGKVKMKISFNELLKKGKKKAKEVFSIA
ncbi:MAG: hypothetical protein LC768_00880 [Acidobacteria bacterium]|nr:hypothetical protein [Acidobacteriota bacterium]MCA1636889.1 hypothetical protein [Acidobacteriota bacterium]